MGLTRCYKTEVFYIYCIQSHLYFAEKAANTCLFLCLSISPSVCPRKSEKTHKIKIQCGISMSYGELKLWLNFGDFDLRAMFVFWPVYEKYRSATPQTLWSRDGSWYVGHTQCIIIICSVGSIIITVLRWSYKCYQDDERSTMMPTIWT